MRLSWPSSRGNRRILTDREDEESAAMAETPVLYDMPSSPGSISTTNDAATLIASPDQTTRRNHYRADQLEAISVVSDDDEDDDEFEQRRQLLTDVIILLDISTLNEKVGSSSSFIIGRREEVKMIDRRVSCH